MTREACLRELRALLVEFRERRSHYGVTDSDAYYHILGFVSGLNRGGMIDTEEFCVLLGLLGNANAFVHEDIRRERQG